MMRSRQDSDFESLMARCDGNSEVQKKCESDESFNKGYKKTIKGLKQLLEVVLGNLFLKDEQFRVLEPADSEQIGRLEEGLSTLDENLKNSKSLIEADKSPKFEEFYEKHCVSRTYFFQVQKCSDASCTFHKPLHCDQNINVFPDPEPYEEEGVTHYRQGQIRKRSTSKVGRS